MCSFNKRNCIVDKSLKIIKLITNAVRLIPDNFEIVAIDTPGGNLSLKIKSRAQQITLKPNIIKVKILIS
jgi:hypothetical protein